MYPAVRNSTPRTRENSFANLRKLLLRNNRSDILAYSNIRPSQNDVFRTIR